MRFLLGVLVGLILAAVLSQPAVAQAVNRMFGTQSNGTARAIVVDANGAVLVAVQ